MAKNLMELELQLMELRNKKKELRRELRADLDHLQESVKPVNLIKRGFTDLLSNKNSQNLIASSAAGLMGSMLMGGKGNLLRMLLGQVMESSLVQDFIEKEKPRLGEWVEKLKSMFSKKAGNSETMNEQAQE
jgi:hypothetical protein